VPLQGIFSKLLSVQAYIILNVQLYVNAITWQQDIRLNWPCSTKETGKW